MRQSYAELISELLTLLGEEEKAACQKIIDCLTELGYVPQKQKVQCYIVSFKNNSVNQTIAKIGVRSGKIKGAFYSIKFYACKNPPQKFLNAVQTAILKSTSSTNAAIAVSAATTRKFVAIVIHILTGESLSGAALMSWRYPTLYATMLMTFVIFSGSSMSTFWPAIISKPLCIR